MRIPGLKTLRRSTLWLRTRFAPGAVVLGYHRVAETVNDPFGLCVSPQHFSEQLEVIRTLAAPLPLSALVGYARSGSLPKRALAITFDDGYADLLDTAAPLLQQAELPAVVFVPSGLLGTEFWWDRLERILDPAAVRRAAYNGIPSLDSLHLRLRSLPSEEREQELFAIGAQAIPLATELPRCITADELRTLAADPLIEVGAHTRTHPWLPSLSAMEQRAEIRKCRRELEDIIGAQVCGFSYPYGSESPALREEVRAAGYAFACGSKNDVLTADCDLYAIPRFWVPNQDGDRFARWLRRWLHD